MSAVNEFSLRGPFPAAATARIMRSTGRLLDAFHAMSFVEQRKGLHAYFIAKDPAGNLIEKRSSGFPKNN